MPTLDPVIVRQLPMIDKIIHDEVWLESERRGTAVGRHDPIVREKVCQIVLTKGAEMRERARQDFAATAAM